MKIFSVIFATLLAMSTVASFAEDEPCYEFKVECVKYIREAAEQGISEAQFILGFMHHKGKIVKKDYRDAARWFRLAAEQGNADAQYSLGFMYEKGDVVEDKREAVRWYRLAAEQGNADAQFSLGTNYYKGTGVEKDEREAYIWLSIFKLSGDKDADEILLEKDLWQKYLTSADILSAKREAAQRFEEIEKRKNSSQSSSNNSTQKGGEESAVTNSCIEPKAECLEYVREAAEQGNPLAQSILGLMYHKGEGVTKDYREGTRWFRLAAEQGNAVAHFALGAIYFSGDGVVQNKHEAYIWLLIAKAGGIERVDDVLKSEPWRQYLVFADIESAKREAAQRFEKIEKRKNSAESSNNNSARNSGEEFAIAKPPEETNIAAKVFENTWRSVVMIKDAEGQGSGVIIRPNLVATNCHVVEGGDVAVYKPENGRINESTPFSAKVVYRKEEHDFCILEVKGLWGIAATIRKYDTLKVGENVYALGAPRGLNLSLSNGLVSQLRTDDGRRFIQTDAAISPGSSGGGLFDTKGSFIGILTSKYTAEGTEGIGFAIPADLALEF